MKNMTGISIWPDLFIWLNSLLFPDLITADITFDDQLSLKRKMNIVEISGISGPAAPEAMEDFGVEPRVVSELCLKFALTVPHFTSIWMSERLAMPLVIVNEMLEQLREDHLLEVLGATGAFGFRYAIAGAGKQYAMRLMEISGYTGPTPVSLEDYTHLINDQVDRTNHVTAEQVQQSLSTLVLPDQAIMIAGLALSSARSLFVFGPPGNGKTALARGLNDAQAEGVWIPYAITIDQNIIRVYDEHIHEVLPVDPEIARAFDSRWVRIKRPMVVVGGELTIEDLDLKYSSTMRYYEAPIHMKANGGIFLVDDFGRQRADPKQLLNRWIIPMENRLDYLSLANGQKIQIPFRLCLIFATNLNPRDVTDPAFLRRIGYRLEIKPPHPEQYSKIFHRYIEKLKAELDPTALAWLFKKYETEKRELRGCEPRDLLERIREICEYRQEKKIMVNPVNLEMAWTAYFGGSDVPYSDT